MAKFVVFFIAALAFHAALAAPKKNQGQQQGGAQKNQVEEVVEQFQHTVDEVTTSLKKVLPDEKQVAQDLAAKSQKFASDVEDIVKKLQSEIGKSKDSTDQLLQQVSTKLTENINALKQAVGPDATAKVNEIKNQLDTHFKDAASEFGKLVDIAKPNLEKAGATINTFAQGILNDFVKAAEDLKTQVDNTVEGNTRKMKQH